jgi:uncharacterized protein YcgI (DUF1989 family)
MLHVVQHDTSLIRRTNGVVRVSRRRVSVVGRPWGYLPADASAIAVDRPFYQRIAAETAGRTLTHQQIVPIRSGYAWPMRAGQVGRIVAVAGPQVVDFNAWNLHNPRERFWAARTRQLESTHLTTFNRLWSTLPYLRPLLTITNETIQYGEDAGGGRCHDLLGSRCDPYVTKLLSGETFNFNCHANLTRAVLPWHLDEADVHDVLNIFQVTGLDAEGRYFMKASPAKQGDVFEFLAEIDLLCAISTCPGGDLSVPLWGPDAGDPLPTCKPIGVEVYDLPAELLEGWQSPQPSDYAGLFGLRQPVWGEEG